MKSAIFALSLLGLAAAQPHRHAGRHGSFHERRDVVTEVDVVTATAPDVIVYVDEDGNPVSTYYPGMTPATAQPDVQAAAATPDAYQSYGGGHGGPHGGPHGGAPSYSHSFGGYSSSAPPAPVYTTTAAPAPAPTTTEAPPPPPPTTTAAPPPPPPTTYGGGPASYTSASPPSGSSTPGNLKGIGYSPYSSSGGCKTQDEVNADFDKIGSAGYGLVRIYGTDCNQVSTVYSAAKAHNMQVFAGVFDISKVNAEINTMIQGVNGDWSHIYTVSIGNELVNDGQATPDQVISAIGTARGLLKNAGYTGKVVTVDTFVAMINHPELCKASDYAAANAHAFFDSTATPDQAGSWTLKQAQAVSSACGGMDTWITEAGWPSAGECNGSACPSPANQQTAISSLNSAFSSNLIVFSAYNDQWKQDNSGTFGSEKFWGVYGNSAS